MGGIKVRQRLGFRPAVRRSRTRRTEWQWDLVKVDDNAIELDCLCASRYCFRP